MKYIKYYKKKEYNKSKSVCERWGGVAHSARACPCFSPFLQSSNHGYKLLSLCLLNSFKICKFKFKRQ